MINMIKADFYRIFKSKAFYIGIFFMLLMVGVSIYLIEPGYIGMSAGLVETNATPEENLAASQSDELSLTAEDLTGMSIKEMRAAKRKLKHYKLDRDIISANMNLYYIFIFITALAVAADFSGSCIKNTLSSAISRKQYFLSKVIFINLCCIGLLFLNTYVTYFSNILFNGKNLASGFGEVTKATLQQLPAILALVAVETGLAFMLKKTALFNTVTIPLAMIFQMLLSLAVALFKIKESYLSYEPQAMLAKLSGNPSGSYLTHSYLLCGAVIIVFYCLGYMCFRKAEIK